MPVFVLISPLRGSTSIWEKQIWAGRRMFTEKCTKPKILGRASQLSGTMTDYSVGCEGFCDVVLGPEGRTLQRISWRICVTDVETL